MEWYGILLACIGGAVGVVFALNAAFSPARWPLTSRTVVITGGSSGIGKSVAEAALRSGAHVALIARRTDVLASAREELTALGLLQRVTTHSVDVTSDLSMREGMQAIATAHGGRIDALICSAGTSMPRDFEVVTAKEFEDVWRVNVLGTRNAVAAALPFMTDGGRIVLVSSQAGQAGIYGYTSYAVRERELSGDVASQANHTNVPPPLPPSVLQVRTHGLCTGPLHGALQPTHPRQRRFPA